jgi:hypothetical protein
MEPTGAIVIVYRRADPSVARLAARVQALAETQLG